MSTKVLQELKLRAALDPVVGRKMIASPLRYLADFDLTLDEKIQLILPRFSWIIEQQLAATPFPQSDDAYWALRHLGIKTIMNLTGYRDDAPLLSAFTLHHIPIPDMHAPTLAQTHQAVSLIQTSLRNNHPVAIHCMAGLGRTGTIAAAYLVTLDQSPQEAISSIRSTRPGSIETEEQEQAVYQYANDIATSHS